MKTFVVAFSLLGSVAAAQAAETIAVFAKEEGLSSVNMGEASTILKRHSVVLRNVGSEDRDLTTGCLILSANSDPSATGDVYHVDTIDENLVSGTLAPDGAVEGNVAFAANTQDVLDAHFVHYLANCPAE